MRTLMLAHRIPYPPHTGDKVRAFHVARHLARRGDLTLAFVVDDRRDQAGIETLRAQFTRVECVERHPAWGVAKGALGLARRVPVTLSYFASHDLRTRLRHLLAETRYDLIYVSSAAMAQYIEPSLATPMIMDFVDVDSDKWMQYARRSRPPLRWLYQLEGKWLRTYEAGVARWATRCLLATRAEEALLRSFAPWARTEVVPNGVDLAEFTPGTGPALEPIILFTGAMDYYPNVDAVTYFADQIFPTVRRHVPSARFLIVGLNPAPPVIRLGRQPGITVTGAVPDVRPYYAEAAVAVAPLRIARGIQNKVLQAMAMGVPVVATPLACQGIEAEAGADLAVADDPAAFAQRLVALLADPTSRRALAERGRAFVEAHHSWEASLAGLDRVLESLPSSGIAPVERSRIAS